MCSLFVIFKLYLPILLFLISLISFFSLTSSQDSADIVLNYFNLIKYKSPVQNYLITKIIIACIGVGSILSYLFYDYTKFFDTKLEFEIFYDSQGLEENLKDFQAEELIRLNIQTQNYKQTQNIYYQYLDEDLEKIIPSIAQSSLSSGFFMRKKEVISQGLMTMWVSKKSVFQSYHVVKAEGYLTHYLAGESNSKAPIFRTYFEKVSSRNDFLKLSLSDIYLKHKNMLVIQFKQTLIASDFSKSARFNRILYSITKLYFLPYPRFSNTIHLFDNNGQLVPIAYSVYK